MLLDREDDEDTEDEYPADRSYADMSDEEFFATIRSENADMLGVSEERLDEMSFDEIEKRLGIKTGKPRHPKGSPEGYLDTSRYDVLSESDYEERKATVEEFLNS